MHEITARQPKRVLLIEDDHEFARMTQLMLETPVLGVEGIGPESKCIHGQWIVTCASTAQTAVSLLHDNPFDILLCDLILPDAEREDLIRLVREAAPQRPIVVHSGLSDIELVRRLLCGDAVADYIVKGDVTSGCALKQRLCHAIDRFHVICDVREYQSRCGGEKCEERGR